MILRKSVRVQPCAPGFTLLELSVVLVLISIILEWVL